MTEIGWLTENGLTFKIRVIAQRKAYGRTDKLVTPIEGAGEKWVNETRITPSDGKTSTIQKHLTRS